MTHMRKWLMANVIKSIWQVDTMKKGLLCTTHLMYDMFNKWTKHTIEGESLSFYATVWNHLWNERSIVMCLMAWRSSSYHMNRCSLGNVVEKWNWKKTGSQIRSFNLIQFLDLCIFIHKAQMCPCSKWSGLCCIKCIN